MNLHQLKTRSQPALRLAGVAIAIVVATSAFSTASFATPTAEQRSACMPDVMRLCLASLGNNNAIISCMTKNKDRLSARCKSTLPPI